MPKELRTARSDEIFKEMVTARLERGGETFEILVKPDAVEKIREGQDVDIIDSLAIDAIFRDVKKGLRASEEKMKELFGTDDPVQVAELIIKKGTIHLSTEQRRALQEAKRKRIVSYIAANAINPQTGTPHPPQRIELAMEEAKVHVDPFKPVEEQVGPIVDALRPLIPIRIERAKIAVKLMASDVGRCYGEIRAYGSVLKEEWQPDGTWIGVVEIPAGLQGEFLDRLNEKTHGNVETKILK
jgi:ribosome maturation protein SDO1